MTQNQIEAIKLINQINELAEKLSSLIKSDSKNFYGYSLTLATSVVDENRKLKVNSIISGNSLDLANVHTEIMAGNEDYFNMINWALAKVNL